MTEAHELLPCPFCGRNPYLANVEMAGCAYVVCTGCRVQTDDGSKDRVIAKWNTRAAQIDAAYERGRRDMMLEAAKAAEGWYRNMGKGTPQEEILALISDDTPAPRGGMRERAVATVFDPCAGSAGLLVGHDPYESSGSPAAVSEPGPVRAVDEAEALIDQLLKHVAADDYIQGYKAACRTIRKALPGGAKVDVMEAGRLIREAADILSVERDGLASGITINGEISQDLDDQSARDAIATIDDWTARAAALIARAEGEVAASRGDAREPAGWRDIAGAPNGVAILMAYDNGEVTLVSAEDNDFDWMPYKYKAWALTPSYWMPLPAPPAQEVESCSR